MPEFKLSYTGSEVNDRLGAVEKTIRYDKQNLTESQKSQARNNIGLPTITTSDAGKFMRVSADGKWVVEAIPSAEEASF